MNGIIVCHSIRSMSRIRKMEALCSNRVSGGYVYIIEFGDNVKIGNTMHPTSRILNHANNAKNYCLVELKRIAVSWPHSNFIQNEIYLQTLFEEKRIGTGELFSISFETAMDAFYTLNLEMEIKLNPLSRAIYEKRADKINLSPLDRAQRRKAFEKFYTVKKQEFAHALEGQLHA